MSVKEEKDCKRFLLKKQRRNIEDKASKDRAIANRLFELSCYQQAEQVLLYRSMPEEVGTELIWGNSCERHQSIFFPYCVPNTHDMKFYEALSESDFKKSRFGVWEPNPHRSKPLLLQKNASGGAICIVPGLSFTQEGLRLGYGMGFYDRFLSSYPAFSIGLCYDEMLSDDLPADEFDYRVDMVVTDKRVITVKGLEI